MPRYLERRRRRWYAVLDVPRDLREIVGKARLMKSLETESQTEAERLVLSVVAQWKTEFEAARRGVSLPVEVQAKLANADYERADEFTRETLDLVFNDELEDLRRQSPLAADTYYHLRRGQSISLLERLDEWLASNKNVPKSIDMKRSDVLRFIKAYPYSHLVSKTAVRQWAYELQHTDGLRPSTIRRIVSACRGYWEFLQRKNYIKREDEPFSDAVERRGSRTKAGTAEKRLPFRADEVVSLLAAANLREDIQLHDLIFIAMWTGCRIEEICSLKLGDVTQDRISIDLAKSPAGNRIVPVHPELATTLFRLVQSSNDGYVLSGLSFNKYGDRSNAIGKRFGRMKSEAGFGPSYVFHSIRKTVATLLENAGVPENVSADILGHKKKTMTYGLYSGGTSFELKRNAILKLNYA